MSHEVQFERTTYINQIRNSCICGSLRELSESSVLYIISLDSHHHRQGLLGSLEISVKLVPTGIWTDLYVRM